MKNKINTVATVRKIRDAHYRKFKGRPLKEWFDSTRSESALLDKEIASKKHSHMSHKY